MITGHINMSVITIVTSGKTQAYLKKKKKLIDSNYKICDVLNIINIKIICYIQLK